MRDISSVGAGGAPALSESGWHRVVLVVFTFTLFFSALLLFAVQPMFAKIILPILGGAPAVWAVAMVFFQTALLLGYAYAHALTRWCPIRFAPVVHLMVLIGGGVMLPLGVAAGWSEPPVDGLHFWVFGLFAVSIGLPFMALSANGPLLQAWFSTTDHPTADDPYFLYGASNFGSLLALLLYPLMAEPLLAVRQQTGMWTSGYWMLAFSIGGCGLLTYLAWRAGGRLEDASSTRAVANDEGDAVTWKQRGAWIALAAIPSALLVAVSNYITTDVAAVPLLWVIPLALFLITFIIVFQRKPVLPHWMMVRILPFVAGLLLLTFFMPVSVFWVMSTLVHLVAFFVMAMVCHGELVARRPSAHHLTQFYLFMSFGGMLGGLFVGLIAPQIFSMTSEYPLMAAVSLLALRGVWSKPLSDDWVSFLVFGLLACAVFAFPFVTDFVPGELAIVWLALATVLFVAVALSGENPRRLFLLYSAGMLIAVNLSASALGSTYYRGFFGVHRVSEREEGKFQALNHGTTLHGMQLISEVRAGAAVKRPSPLSYYHPKSGFADAIRSAQSLDNMRSIGVVGLGSGALACYRQDGESWKFYEIDPLVVQIAQDPRHFTFMSNCAPGSNVVVGDARITVSKEKDAEFSLLVIDAFSSDVVPAHLLTIEAIKMYLSKLTEDGVLLMHVSNRHAALEPVLAAAVDELGLKGTASLGQFGPDFAERGYFIGHVVAISRTDKGLAGLRKLPHWRDLEPRIERHWTDDYSNVLGAIWAHKTASKD